MLKLKVFLCLMGTVLCFEILVRMFVVSPAVVNFDAELGAMKAPFSHIFRTYEGFNRYTNDAYGFNNDAFPEPRPSHRLLILGDSFVEAKHVPRAQNFVAKLNALPDVWAYNAGYSGADPRSFPLLAQRFLPIMQPTQLVLCVNADDLTALDSVALPAYVMPTGIKAWLQPLFAHSALATHLNWKYKSVFQDWWQAWQPSPPSQPAATADDYTLYVQHWRTILQQLADNGVPIAVLILPSLRYEAQGIQLVYDAREQALASAATHLGFKVLRTEQAFVQAFASHGDVGFGFMNSHLGQGHLNAAGHQIVAKLLQQGLLP